MRDRRGILRVKEEVNGSWKFFPFSGEGLVNSCDLEGYRNSWILLNICLEIFIEIV